MTGATAAGARAGASLTLFEEAAAQRTGNGVNA